jgi:hypothetical protein
MQKIFETLSLDPGRITVISRKIISNLRRGGEEEAAGVKIFKKNGV